MSEKNPQFNFSNQKLNVKCIYIFFQMRWKSNLEYKTCILYFSVQFCKITFNFWHEMLKWHLEVLFQFPPMERRLPGLPGYIANYQFFLDKKIIISIWGGTGTRVSGACSAINYFVSFFIFSVEYYFWSEPTKHQTLIYLPI